MGQSATAIIKRRLARDIAARKPWSADEDAELEQICRVGLSCEFWSIALPTRTHAEVCDRRFDLKIPIAPLL